MSTIRASSRMVSDDIHLLIVSNSKLIPVLISYLILIRTDVGGFFFELIRPTNVHL